MLDDIFFAILLVLTLYVTYVHSLKYDFKDFAKIYEINFVGTKVLKYKIT